MLNRQQMELSLENMGDARPWRQRRRRQTRARWWFNRMHEVVDQAREWVPGDGARRNQPPPFIGVSLAACHISRGRICQEGRGAGDFLFARGKPVCWDRNNKWILGTQQF